jgi:hypothetical protein
MRNRCRECNNALQAVPFFFQDELAQEIHADQSSKSTLIAIQSWFLNRVFSIVKGNGEAE